MARPYRFQSKDCFYHVMSRGNHKKEIFISDSDYNKFFEYLMLAKTKYNFNLYAYCLMPNHYHLFIQILQPNLSKIMHYINTSYTIYYNRKQNEKGHLFQGRFKSILVDEDNYFFELTRYIHLNPVKAKIVSLPQKYKWSSFNGYIKPKTDRYLDYSEIESRLAMNPKEYKNFVLGNIHEKETLLNNVYAGFLLGEKEFIKDKVKKLGRQIESGNFSHKKKIKSSVLVEDIITEAGKIFKEDVSNIINKKNSTSNTRKAVIYSMRRLTTLNNKQIGKYFNITDSAVGKAEKRVAELLKENKDFRGKVEKMFSVFRV